jgi:hypothetical protein
MKRVSAKGPRGDRYTQHPPRLRAARLEECRSENGRIVERYIEAIEDVSATGGITQKRINERLGL